ncbi:hypothetical protein [Agrobacterium sp. AGB01]|uniref:hypothetical protein n=1 Tax=Agrobacterium sp. AGB01 TaxID=2769302 RepID=UPI0017809B49|nr:hypothetical protein [Agrobacterium sp. AGB01]
MITSGSDYGGHELAPQVRYVGKLLLALLLAAMLAGCQGESADVRYRVIANFDVDGKPFAASTVMEIRYSRVTQSLIGAGGATRLYGETLIADIPGKGTIYILPIEHQRDGALGPVWANAILQTLGIKSSIGSLADEDFER